MKKIVIFALLIMLSAPIFVHAGSPVGLTWDAVQAGDLAGYRVYQTDVSGQYQFGAAYAVATIPAGTETVTLDVADGKWWWVVTAYDLTGNESGPSSEVT